MSASRRWSGDWAKPLRASVPLVDVLIPTSGRGTELGITLAGLAAQDDPPFRVVLSDQSDEGSVSAEPGVQAMLRVLAAQGREVLELRHLPRRGLAEHRQFLLDKAEAEFVLFLDDDVWIEPGTLRRMTRALTELGCGFLGSAVQGLSYLDDERPGERAEFATWDDGVQPERIRRDTPSFARWALHNAANLAHQAAEVDVEPGGWIAYRVAWVGGCVLYRRSALVETGGFTFWSRLPEAHSGEDVAAQWRVMERFGGAGILPSGAVHLEAPTTVPDRSNDALDIVFPLGP